jgi:hypothetical protein
VPRDSANAQLREKKDQAHRLLMAKKFERAIVILRELMVLEPRDSNFCLKYAEASLRLGRKDEAAQGYLMAAELLFEAGHYPRAAAAVRQGLEFDPMRGELHRLWLSIRRMQKDKNSPPIAVPTDQVTEQVVLTRSDDDPPTDPYVPSGSW